MPSQHTVVSRRQVIRAGLTGLAGLSLPNLLRLQSLAASQGGERRNTAVIYILQEGGASQFETWDPKPEAPAEIRGDFSPIATKVPDIQFCETMAEQARVADKLVVLRSIHHPSTQHSSSVHLIKTGYYCRPESNDNEMPACGSYVSRFRGGANPGVPEYVTLNGGSRYGRAFYLGQGYDPFDVASDPSRPGFTVPNLTLMEGINTKRLEDRRRLLADFDHVRRAADRGPQRDAVDPFVRRAFEMVTGERAREAFQLSAEPDSVREKYGRTPMGQSFLLARRLVERGVSFVSVGTLGWDHHGGIVEAFRRDVPPFDRALAALVDDVHARGLADRVLIVCLGEFGRSPRMSSLNSGAPGRDHWGDVMSVLMSGGGLAGGRVIGASDRTGGSPALAPYRVECVLAHMYRFLGIDPSLTFPDHAGRPRALLDIREPIRELA